MSTKKAAVQAEDESSETSAAQSDAPPAPPEIEWLDMADAPHDGRIILLTPDLEQVVEARWYKTRDYNVKACKWEETSRWVLSGGGRQRVPYEPLGWRHME
jgi:hypothetical protein